MFHRCKITVVKRMLNPELIQDYLSNPNHIGLCHKVADNQVFIANNPFEMPEGICESAWADIRPYIMTIAAGGSFEFMKEKHSALASCSDLFRPVIFKIERMDEKGCSK